ncbi:MAG TPA: hypothetical protein VHS99_26720 [Chloroflexota bacterium]|nr:hypothetical protein [Chloroflexota bacterium]
MRQTVLLLDQTAESAIASAASFLAARGVPLTHRSPYSVAFGAPAPAGAATRAEIPQSPADALLPPGTGQIAAVPVQLKPEWSRVWVTVEGDGPAIDAASAYIKLQQARSERVGAQVQALEQGIYDESRWPAYEATLRANLARQQLSPEALEARIAAFKRRWLALGRKAAAQGQEDAQEDAPP